MAKADSNLDSVEAAQRYRQLLAAGDYDQAESQLREAIAAHRDDLGPDSYQVAVDTHRLATVLAASGRLDEAVEHYQRALAIKRQQLGPGHPDLAVTLHDLAVLYAATERGQEAHSLWTEARATLQDGRPAADESDESRASGGAR